MNDIADKIIKFAVVILGCILIRFGIDGSGSLITIGFILITGVIMAQVALMSVPLFKAISDRRRRSCMNDIAATIIMSTVVILGCILIHFGLLHGRGIPITIGFILLTGGIMVQVALMSVPLFKAISDRAATIIMSAAVLLGLSFFGLDGRFALITIGIILIAGGIMAQVALMSVPLSKAIRDRIKEKKAEKEEDSVGPGIIFSGIGGIDLAAEQGGEEAAERSTADNVR